MQKTLKFILIAIAALIALLLLALGIIAATFDPNAYKSLLVRVVQDKTHRTLSIPGQIKLGFFPNLALELGKARLSERGGDAEFASVDGARLSLELLPLLARKAVVDKIAIDGLHARIARDAQGGTNYDDLMSSEQGGGQQVLFDIDSIRITDANLVYEDRQQNRRLELAHLDLQSGRIADGVPGKLQLSADIKANRPQIDAHAALKTGFTLDLGAKRFALKQLDAALNGRYAGFDHLALALAGNAVVGPAADNVALEGVRLSANGKRAQQTVTGSFEIPKLVLTGKQASGSRLTGNATLSEGARTLSATFSAPGFEGSPQAFRIPGVVLDASLKEPGLDANARAQGAFSGDLDKLLFTSPQLALTLSGQQRGSTIGGTLTTPVRVDLKAQKVELAKLSADFKLPNPGGGTVALAAAGSASANLDKQVATATLHGALDQSTFDARLGLGSFSPASYTFDIGIDKLDLDRYRGKPETGAAAASTGGAPPSQPTDLSALQSLRAHGSARVGALKVAGIHASDVRFELQAAHGKVDLRPLAANLYGGKLAGALGVVAVGAGSVPRFSLQQTLSDVDVGPLLQDAVGKRTIDGKGNVQLDVSASGLQPDRIMQALNGSARLALRDGAIHGVNIAQAVRSAKAKLGELRGNEAPQSGKASSAEKTDFSELTGSFRITNGVAHNDDLIIKSPLLRVSGAGDVNLAAQRLDYTARASIVSSLQGQGGPELQALKGLTVPVKLSGPFSALDWSIDFRGLASELAQQRLEGKKEELKAKAQKSLEEKKTKLQEQLKNQLEGLFKK